MRIFKINELRSQKTIFALSNDTNGLGQFISGISDDNYKMATKLFNEKGIIKKNMVLDVKESILNILDQVNVIQTPINSKNRCFNNSVSVIEDDKTNSIVIGIVDDNINNLTLHAFNVDKNGEYFDTTKGIQPTDDYYPLFKVDYYKNINEYDVATLAWKCANSIQKALEDYASDNNIKINLYK